MKGPDPDRRSDLGPLFGGEQVTGRSGPPIPSPEPRHASKRKKEVRLWNPGDAASKKPVRIGTCGYSFRDWVGPFYPPGTPPSAMLPYYAARFPAVEVNVTYYRLPGPRVFEQIERKTPDGFEFFVKLQADLTHKRDRDPLHVEAFLEAVAPLQRAGKLQGALAQFPWSFRSNRENRDYLRWLGRAYTPRPLVIEFRHKSWDDEETYRLLSDEGLTFCCVDEPKLPGLFPGVVKLTGNTGYVRLHGRNSESWWGGQGSERYNYLYSQEELQEWVDKVRELASQAPVTYVFFNNCHAGRAAHNARTMGELLGLAEPGA
jgi:uncharacterized protein YecE (DUF72 family)